MLADQLDYVIGVDPHRDAHAIAVVEVVSGAVVSRRPSPQTVTATHALSRSSTSTAPRVGARSLSRGRVRSVPA